jgi:hypothetical protein
MISEAQNKFYAIVKDLMETDGKTELQRTYQSVIAMVYSLIENRRIDDLNKALMENFPEYYNKHH